MPTWLAGAEKGLEGELIIDIYQFGLIGSSAQVRAAELILSEDERARFGHMIVPWCNRSIIARATLRHLLGMRLGIDPREVLFDYGEYGKPSLAHIYKEHISFNLAHSADLGVIAIGNGIPIGIDLEEIKEGIDHDLLVEGLFSSRELAVFRRLPIDQRRAAFYRAWTIKEAFVKATGEGLLRPLSTLEVAFEQEDDVRMLLVPRGWASKPWSLMHLTTAPNFIGAIAVGSPRIIARHHEVHGLFGIS